MTGESDAPFINARCKTSWLNALDEGRQKLLLRLKSTMADGSYIVQDSSDKKFFHFSSGLAEYLFVATMINLSFSF